MMHSDDEDGDARDARFDAIVRDVEVKNARKFEKIRRTTTPRTLESGSGSGSGPRWLKKRMHDEAGDV